MIILEFFKNFRKTLSGFFREIFTLLLSNWLENLNKLNSIRITYYKLTEYTINLTWIIYWIIIPFILIT